MAKTYKIRHRLPVGVVQKLSENSGGGKHQKKKGRGSYTRKEKHGGKEFRETDVSFPTLSSSSHKW